MKSIKIINKVLILLVTIFSITCNLNEIKLVDTTGSYTILNNCKGIKLDLIIRQDTAGTQIYTAEIIDGRISFRLSENNNFNFDKELYMAFIVENSSNDYVCPFKEKSMYEAMNIRLKSVFGEYGMYEIELYKFRKIY